MSQKGGRQCCRSIPCSASGGVIWVVDQNASAKLRLPALRTTITSTTGGTATGARISKRRRKNRIVDRREASPYTRLMGQQRSTSSPPPRPSTPASLMPNMDSSNPLSKIRIPRTVETTYPSGYRLQDQSEILPQRQ